MKQRFHTLAVLLALWTAIPVHGQYTKEFKRIFFDAETLYHSGFYEEAFNRYRNLLTLDPGNHNILFRCGACCLNINGSEQQAITYLRQAVEGVSPDYKDKSHKESMAPVLAYFMLGRAYHLHNEFDEAVDQYERYLTEGMDEDPVQREFARLQIEACGRAEKVVEARPSFEFQSVLDQFDDDLPSCNNPVISGDGNRLIFLVDYPSDRKIMMTERNGDLWTRPRVINSEIGMVGETEPASLSYDGTDLYLVHHFYSHSDIFISHYRNGRWTRAEALGNRVNGRTSETHASISRDGNTLYFTSDARGSLGSFDIFVTRKDEKGEWDVPENLGPVINTPYEEHTPFISSNDSILFFSSQGHSSIGGLDVFYSELGPGGSWGEPVNIGYPVNTTRDNTFFNPGWNELDGYYAVQREDDPTANTINMVIEVEPEEETAAPALTEEPESGDTPATREPDPETESSPPPTVEAALEPEETGEIHEILNRRPEPEPVAVPAAGTGSRTLLTTVPFDHNDFRLGMTAQLEVEKIADLMRTYPDTRLEITGRADATGSSEYNLLLSSQRAHRVALYLEEQGIDPGRITAHGVGEQAPLARETLEDGTEAPLGRYLNRLVTLKLESPDPLVTDLAGLYVPVHLRIPEGQESGTLKETVSDSWYTIQVGAALAPIPTGRFRGLTELTEHACRDGYYRYTTGRYPSFSDARRAQALLRNQGYPDAFIQTLGWYHKAAR